MSTAASSVAGPWPALPERKGYEYADGRWVRLRVSNLSTFVAAEFYLRLATFVREHDLGQVYPHEFGYQIWGDAPLKYRKPDGSFISRGRLASASELDPLAHVPPDLVIEVISPTDRWSDVDEKVQEYFDAGVRLVWVLDPRTRSVLACRDDGSALRLVGEAILGGEDVVPGFAVRVSDLFPASIG